MNDREFEYVGNELEIFAIARNWKNYLRRSLASHLRGSVAEVGAGIGATSEILADADGVAAWLCIEPDAAQAAEISEATRRGALPRHCSVFVGTLSDLPPDAKFDSIVYVDVLEHIEKDREELASAAARLNPGGRLIVLSPAWQSLYSKFDEQIGHYRRYRIRTLRTIAPPQLAEFESYYLDSVGMLASLANRLFLKQGAPKKAQILTWDRLMVPMSRLLDRLILRRAGRSVVIVWQKP